MPKMSYEKFILSDSVIYVLDVRKQKLNAQILSVQTGNWNATTTWSCSCVPTSADDVKIVAGHTVFLTTNQTVNNLELVGNLNLNTNSRTLTVNGNFKGSGTSTLLKVSLTIA